MVRQFLRIFSIPIILLSFYLAFSFGRAPLIEGRHIIDPYIDTHFSDKYTPEKFENIELGMTLQEVVDELGQPFFITPAYGDSLNTQYRYTADGKLLSKRTGQAYSDCAWYRSSVTFDTTWIVISIDKGWSYD